MSIEERIKRLEKKTFVPKGPFEGDVIFYITEDGGDAFQARCRAVQEFEQKHGREVKDPDFICFRVVEPKP